eukprot:555735_1
MAKCTVSISLSFIVLIITSFRVLVPCVGQMCITGETDHSNQLNGVYSYYNYDYTNGGRRYYNSDTGYYLYPWISSSGYYKWYIQSDYTTSTVFALANIDPTPSSTYVFDVEDGNGNWQVWSNSQWISQSAMRVESCTGDCGGTFSWLSDGECDTSNNNADCNWDDGDCCAQSCVENDRFQCDSFACLDPIYAPISNVTSCNSIGDVGTSGVDCTALCSTYFGSCSTDSYLYDDGTASCQCCYCSSATTTSEPITEDDFIWTILLILLALAICAAIAQKLYGTNHDEGEDERDLETYQTGAGRENHTQPTEFASSPVIQYQPDPQTTRQSPHFAAYQTSVPMQQHHQSTIQYEKQRTQSQPTLPKGWRSAMCADGRLYYQNDITQETQWNVPTHNANNQTQPRAKSFYDEEEETMPENKTAMSSLKKEWNELMDVIEYHTEFMKTHEKNVDQIIASSGNNRKLLQRAKDDSVADEQKILSQINSISTINKFLEDIILIENLFNSVYTADQRDRQQNARQKYAANIPTYESKPKPCSNADSFIDLVVSGKSTFSAFKTWLQTIVKECEEQKIRIVSNSGAKEKNINRAFYKSFYVYGAIWREFGHVHMSDMLRCSLVFDDFNDLYGCFAIIEKMMKDHGGILRCKDRFHPKDMACGYRDLLINIYCPKSDQKVVCEVQLHHQVFHQYKVESHAVYKKARIFEDKNGNNMAYKYSDKHVRKRIGDKLYECEQKNIGGTSKAHQLLKQWSLDQYSKVLVDDGWDDVDDWSHLTEQKLLGMDFKEGHAKRFMRLVSEQSIKSVPEDKMIE